MDKAAALGRPTVRRAYGDWTTTQLTSCKRVVNALGIRPQQQFRYVNGKNTADFALVMDAMDLIHARCVDGFCLVSSDSDYIGLATRIQEAGLLVYGFGVRQTMREFVVACDAATAVPLARLTASVGAGRADAGVGLQVHPLVLHAVPRSFHL